MVQVFMNKDTMRDLSLILGAIGVAMVMINALDYLTGSGTLTPVIGYFGLGSVAIALLLGWSGKKPSKR